MPSEVPGILAFSFDCRICILEKINWEEAISETYAAKVYGIN
jgi:hypothetical protein